PRGLSSRARAAARRGRAGAAGRAAEPGGERQHGRGQRACRRVHGPRHHGQGLVDLGARGLHPRSSGGAGGFRARAPTASAWWTWWLGDFIGDLLVVPVLLTWARPPSVRPRSERW